MKAPERVTLEQYLVLHDEWWAENADSQGRCRKCLTQIAFTRVPYSIHFMELQCAGSGKVLWGDTPYCPNCEVEPVPGCIHVQYAVSAMMKLRLRRLKESNDQ